MTTTYTLQQAYEVKTTLVFHCRAATQQLQTKDCASGQTNFFQGQVQFGNFQMRARKPRKFGDEVAYENPGRYPFF
jgi:hypothetical protein